MGAQTKKDPEKILGRLLSVESTAEYGRRRN